MQGCLVFRISARGTTDLTELEVMFLSLGIFRIP
jgi:hypothetical protein